MKPTPNSLHFAIVLTALVLGVAGSFVAVEIAGWKEHLGMGKISPLKMS